MSKLKIILIDDDLERAQMTQKKLTQSDFEIVTCLVLNHQNLLPQQQWPADVILFNLTNPQLELVENDIHQFNLPTLLFTQDCHSQSIKLAVAAAITTYIVDEINPNTLGSLVKVALEHYKNYQKLLNDLNDTKTKLADRIDIEKAKVLLMQLQTLTEDQAFALLRKHAMHQRISIGEIARHLLQTQQLLSSSSVDQ